jgi:sugar/nucleoside kinase (ribokinase family)
LTAANRPVVVVGDVCVDVITRATGPLHPGSDTDAVIRWAGGGGGGNIAAWLASLGVPVTLVARVGDDALGRQQTAELTRCGVRCAFTADPAAATGTIVVLVGADGERTMLADRGANLRLRTADLPSALPPGGHLHLSGYTLLHDGPRAAGLAALRRARTAGLTTSVDPASAAPLSTAGADRFLRWTRGADLLLPNLPEARLLSGQADPRAAAHALARHYTAVAVTLGPDGALWASADTVVQVPAERTHAVDTTGAGDAFAAGLLAAWLTGADGPTAVRRGVALAATAVTRMGAR